MNFVLIKKTLITFFLIFSLNLFAREWHSENIIINDNSNIKYEYIKRFVKLYEEEIDKFQRKIGKYPKYRIKIIIAKNKKEYLKIINPKQKIIEFSNASYFPNKNLIVIKNPSYIIDYQSIHRILLHEYIHSFVNYYFKNPPLWFNEGMAVYFSDDFGIDRELRFVYSYLLQNPLTLNDMKYSYPKNRAEWEFFYAKSALAVKYLISMDKSRFIYFWEKAHYKSDFYKIFRLTYLKSVRTFSMEFEKYCKTHFKMMILLGSSTVFWGIMPFLVVIIYIRKKLKYKTLYKKEEDTFHG